MHPNPAFATLDADGALALAHRIGIAHIFLVDREGRPLVAHAPVVRSGPRALRFHLARGNRATRHLDGATVLLSLVGAHGYVTPNWYAAPADQVPTWNYVGVEVDGTARALGEDGLVAQLDALAAQHEPGLSPVPWTRGKMASARFEAMLKAITGFEVTVAAVRATTKLSQNKPAPDRARVVAGLAATGNAALADAMREAM